MCNPDVIIVLNHGLQSKLATPKYLGQTSLPLEETDRQTRGGGVFICVKNDITCSEHFEIIAVEVKGYDPKDKSEIVCFYRAPNEGFRVIERLAERTVYLNNCMRQPIIAGDLNLPKQTD